MAKNPVTKRLKQKLRTSAFMLSLSIGSFIGFIINTYNWFFIGVDSFQWLSVILGLGLLFEGKIKRVYLETFKGKRYKNKLAISKFITLGTGFVVVIGGIMTLPFLRPLLSETIIGAIGIFNVIAIIVIAAEILYID